MTTMRQALATTEPAIIVQTVERPTPNDNEVLLRSSLVGICGSDTHALAGNHPFLYPPYVPGHEAVGIVEAVGSQVDSVEVGARVILKPNLACGKCENCVRGRSNACQSLAWIGCDPSGEHPGALAEYVLAPAHNVFPIPEHISDEEAVLIECLSTPVHAVSLAGGLHGKAVAIIGAGTIGLLCLIAAKHAGAQKVVVVDLDSYKLQRAADQGAAAVVDASKPNVPEAVTAQLGGSADVVFDCVAHESTIDQSLSTLRRAGSLMIVGVPPRELTVNMPRVQDWEIRVQGCAAYTEVDILVSIDIASDGGIPADRIITGRYDLEHSDEAFEEASANSSGKVVVSC